MRIEVEEEDNRAKGGQKVREKYDDEKVDDEKRIGSGCSVSLASQQLQSKTVEIISEQINKRMFPFTAHYFLAIRCLRKRKNALSSGKRGTATLAQANEQ